MTGKPAAVLTENKEPDRESSTENSLPEEPSMDRMVEPEPAIDTELEVAVIDPEVNALLPITLKDPEGDKGALISSP
jgi:hypothetical protein